MPKSVRKVDWLMALIAVTSAFALSATQFPGSNLTDPNTGFTANGGIRLDPSMTNGAVR